MMRFLLVTLAVAVSACSVPIQSVPQTNAPTVAWNAQMPSAKQTPRPTTQLPNNLTTQPSDCKSGYMTFAVNTHDIRYVSNSADTILRLVDIFEKHALSNVEGDGVRGDFYLTAPMVELYAAQRPDVIARLRDSQMTISYHVRPPHPAYPGFDARLKNLDDKTLEQTLRDYETYRMDLTTGNLDKSQVGGYKYVAQVFGRTPVVASPQSGDRRIRAAMLKIYAEMGAKMLVAYHEEGTDIAKPFVYEQGLLQRPSDFSITRVKMENGRENFWWNLSVTPRGDEFNPTKMLQTKLAQWNALRAPFVTALIHEDNFYRSGTPWQVFFYDANDKPLSPPYNLNAPDDSKPRTPTQTDVIFKAYEELVAYAAQNLCVVTSADIVALAKTK